MIRLESQHIVIKGIRTSGATHSEEKGYRLGLVVTLEAQDIHKVEDLPRTVAPYVHVSLADTSAAETDEKQTTRHILRREWPEMEYALAVDDSLDAQLTWVEPLTFRGEVSGDPVVKVVGPGATLAWRVKTTMPEAVAHRLLRLDRRKEGVTLTTNFGAVVADGQTDIEDGPSQMHLGEDRTQPKIRRQPRPMPTPDV